MKANSKTALAFIVIVLQLLFVLELPADENGQGANLSKCRPLKSWYEDSPRGFYQNEICVPAKEEEKTKKIEPPAITEPEQLDWEKLADRNYLDSIPPSEFSNLYERAKEEATWKQSPEKMKAFLTMIDFVRSKGVSFAYAWQDVLVSNPMLDPSTVIPTHSGAVYAVDKAEKAARAEKMTDVAKNAGIFFFASSQCSDCLEEAKVVRWLISDYNLEVRTITVDSCIHDFPNCRIDNKQFIKYGVETTPYIIMVYNDNGKAIIQPLGGGILTEEKLAKRITYYYDIIKTGKYPKY